MPVSVWVLSVTSPWRLVFNAQSLTAEAESRIRVIGGYRVLLARPATHRRKVQCSFLRVVDRRSDGGSPGQ